MAVWSKHPKDLLERIAKHLEKEVDFLRFRSVCSTWRFTVATNPNPSPSRFPILPGEGISNTTWGFHLWKRTIFLLGLPDPHHQTPHGWLIKIEQDLSNRTQLLNPFSKSKFCPFPETSPECWIYRSSEILNWVTSTFCRRKTIGRLPTRSAKWRICTWKKVAVFSGSGIDSHVVLAIHDSGKLAVFKFAEGKWAIIDDKASPYDDVTLFDGQFYAVDSTGRTVIVDVASSPVVNLVADSVFGGTKRWNRVANCF